MRIRLPELLTEHNTTAYEIAQRSNGRIDESTLYRLVRRAGKVRLMDTAVVDALYATLGLKSIAEVVTMDEPPAKSPAKRKRGKG